MKKFVNYLKEYWQSHFQFKTYLAFALFTAALIIFNYSLDFEDTYIDQYFGSNIRIVWFMLFHGFSYYGTLLLVLWLSKKMHRVKSLEFWVISLIGFFILGFDRSFHYLRELRDVVPPATYTFTYKTLRNLTGILTVGVPLLILYWVHDRKYMSSFYGLKLKGVDFRPYWMMLAIMMPILFAGSFVSELADYYPIYRRAQGDQFAEYLGWPEWAAVLTYEIPYLIDFLSTELFFRGFLVIGLVRFLGKEAILPMATTYAVLHFGKPLGETISSIFGGYILGVIALYSRNIWGGVFIHMGVALGMEVFAYLQMLIKN